MDNFSINILESYIEITKYNEKINGKINEFKSKAYELEQMSNSRYELQKSLELNKIFLQGYVLESSICQYLRDNNYTNYSVNQLKQTFEQYNGNFSEELTPYFIALSLYDSADEIEQLVDDKIQYEMKIMFELDESIKEFENINSNYEKLYCEIKDKIKNNYLNKNLIDDNVYNLCNLILNDILNYFVSGYPDLIN